jgi:hypothetical protein
MKISELPKEVRQLALLRQKQGKDTWRKDRNEINLAFIWKETLEGKEYWEDWHCKKSNEEIIVKETIKEEPKHYDNSKGSLYQFCNDKELNTYEFDIIKRVMRCRKKGNFLEDLEKTKFLIDLYIKEQQENYNNICKGNCGMSYCDTNGCTDRKRILTEPTKK